MNDADYKQLPMVFYCALCDKRWETGSPSKEKVIRLANGHFLAQHPDYPRSAYWQDVPTARQQ